MGVHGAQNREIGIVIDYDTIPRRDAMLALPEENRGKACVAKKTPL